MPDTQRKPSTTPLLIKNPSDGKSYDFAPLFDYLEDENAGIGFIPDRLAEICDILPHLLCDTNVELLKDVKSALYYLQQFREIFREIQVPARRLTPRRSP